MMQVSAADHYNGVTTSGTPSIEHLEETQRDGSPRHLPRMPDASLSLSLSSLPSPLTEDSSPIENQSSTEGGSLPVTRVIENVETFHVDMDHSHAEINQTLSELSDPGDFKQGVNPSVGRTAIHDFFYPQRQQPISSLEDENVGNQKDVTNYSTQRRRRQPIQGSGYTQSLSTSSPRNLSKIAQFEDEHVKDNNHSPPRAVPSGGTSQHTSPLPLSPLPLGSPASRSDTVATNNSHPEESFVAQEQQDKNFVEKFWTAYDEILILSLFTQVGILCRLGAASFFRYFDGVFHSDSALFTNLPLNCLSCFVMGMLCSGESLMQIINTRFTPPRLQQDLHQEAAQQIREQQQLFMDDYSSDEGMVEMETEGVRRRRSEKRRRRRQRRGRRRKRTSSLQMLQGQPHESAILHELREVQLLAWERRIRASVCLLLFPVKQEDVDIVENYFSQGYRRESQRGLHEEIEEEKVPESPSVNLWSRQFSIEDGKSHMEPLADDEDTGGFDDLILEEEDVDIQPTTSLTTSPKNGSGAAAQSVCLPSASAARNAISPTPPQKTCTNGTEGSLGFAVNNGETTPDEGLMHARGVPHLRARQYAQVEGGNVIDYGTQDSPDLDQLIANVATGVSKEISRIGRVNLAEGWDVGTSPQEKSEDLVLGLRDGLCGALSSFSSWISSMVYLFKAGQIGQGIVGLMLGIQLPLVAYRFGQYVSIYVFVWRCRREKRRDERRGGYGLQLHTDEEGSFACVADAVSRSNHSFDSGDELSSTISQKTPTAGRTKGRKTVHDEESEIPSVRAIVTALFIMALVAQLTSLNFFYKPEDRLLALSLLFSPLGVLARWRMMKFNSWRPSFPIGTFACNIAACALSGSLGSLLAGNPGPRERIALVSIIAGFGGTLSSVARFIVEILSLMDPILFRLDGLYYAVASAFWGLVVSFVFSASVDWADSVEQSNN